jgi:hypothetical protein
MVSAEFASTVDLLAEMIQGNFRVGLNRNAQDLDEVFQFNKPLDKSEGEKLSVCMKNLRDEMEEKKDKQNF